MKLTAKHVQRRGDQIPQDAALPGLRMLLDAPALTGLLRPYVDGELEILGASALRYVRYKPGTNCLVTHGLRVRHAVTGDEREILLYGKCYTASDFENAAGKLVDHRWAESPGIQPVVPLPEYQIILYAFPNDRVLDGLRVFERGKKVQRLLYEVVPGLARDEWRISDKKLRLEVVRYKPEKRAVVRVASRMTHGASGRRQPFGIYFRTYANDRGGLVFALMQQLQEYFGASTMPSWMRETPEPRRDGNPCIPRALSWVPDRRLLLMEEVDGEDLLDELALAEQDEAARRRLLDGVAANLARLHTFPGASVPVMHASDRLLEAEATARSLRDVAPELADEVAAVFSALVGRLPAEESDLGFVHGDFHHGQVLVQDDGMAVLDYDRAYRGDVLADVGNFVANLHVLEQQRRLPQAARLGDAFVHSYAAAHGSPVDDSRLRFWTGIGLFQASIRPFRWLEPDWKLQTRRILKVCREVLA